MKEKLKQKLLYWLTRHLVPTPSVEDVMMFNKRGQMFIDNALLTGTEIQNLRAEVRFLEESRIWKLINTYFQNSTYKRLLLTESVNDILVVKATLNMLDVQNTVVKNIKGLKDS